MRKSLFDKMMLMSVLYLNDMQSGIFIMQQSTVRHVNPLRHIILTPSQFYSHGMTKLQLILSRTDQELLNRISNMLSQTKFVQLNVSIMCLFLHHLKIWSLIRYDHNVQNFLRQQGDKGNEFICRPGAQVVWFVVILMLTLKLLTKWLN